ncbi:MAG: DNA mismatch repair endonuclease MutL [Puniceicoccales bacterium]|nr:DNA mismatch repair endonuclease MutL [Puniceicoccales bacterium]
MDNCIEKLSEQIINQVAAGEVVERPASIIKELIENSLDANATKIEVRFRRAGKDFISISDDGFAMDRENAILSLSRHTTSKIRNIEDLRTIKSFGFRGEALAAMSSVSRFILETRRHCDATGTKILVDDGEIKKVEECVCACGTHISISMLFKSVPGRRKFLKTDQTEANHIISTVRIFALNFPAVQFSVYGDGRPIFRLQRQETMAERMKELWGNDVLRGLLPIECAADGRRIDGWLWNPWDTEFANGEMLFFVNRRNIASRDLREWILDSYAAHVPRARSVPVFFFLEIPPEQVDVNVHPAKKEVRFSERRKLQTFIAEAIGKTLHGHREQSRGENKIFPFSSTLLQSRSETFEHAVSNILEHANPLPTADSVVTCLGNGGSGEDKFSMECPTKVEWEKISAPAMEEFSKPPKRASSSPAIPAIDSQKVVPPPPVAQWNDQEKHGIFEWQFLGKLNERSVLFKTDTGIIFFDLRRAALRIAYERILSSLTPPVEQRLLIPITLDFRQRTTEVSTEMLEELRRIGFILEEKSTLLYEVFALPNWMECNSGEAFLHDWLLEKRAHLQGLQAELLAEIAAEHVANARQWNGEREISQLVGDLMACDVIQRSPSGGIIYFEISRGELQRRWSG